MIAAGRPSPIAVATKAFEPKEESLEGAGISPRLERLRSELGAEEERPEAEEEREQFYGLKDFDQEQAPPS